MRIVVFEDVSAAASSLHARRVGAWVGADIVDLQRASASLPADLGGLIAGGEPALERARAAVERASREKLPDIVIARDRVRLHAPAVHRPRIACAAGNYAEHTLGSTARKGSSSALADLAPTGTTLSAAEVVEKTRERDRPRGFWKDFALPIGPDGDIPYPARAEHFDYEGEVAAVIGGAPKDVAKGQGASYIWGVTLLNDWSIRGQNVKDSLSFNLGKNFDGGASVGPCILVGSDPSDLVVETHVNGELRQHYTSGDMIFSHAEYLEYLSRDFTFLPGDMIAGGSGPGSATDSAKEGLDLWLKVGDVVEVSSTDIGVLRNRIVAKR